MGRAENTQQLQVQDGLPRKVLPYDLRGFSIAEGVFVFFLNSQMRMKRSLG